MRLDRNSSWFILGGVIGLASLLVLLWSLRQRRQFRAQRLVLRLVDGRPRVSS